jgi:hypothetical protein
MGIMVVHLWHLSTAHVKSRVVHLWHLSTAHVKWTAGAVWGSASVSLSGAESCGIGVQVMQVVASNVDKATG